MSKKRNCGTIFASVSVVLACQTVLNQNQRRIDATKQDVSLTVNLQSKPCAGSWAGLLRSDIIRDFICTPTTGLNFRSVPTKVFGVFVRLQANRFGFCLLAPIASASLFLPYQPACNFLLGHHQLVRDQHHANIQFSFVGPNISPTVSQ